MSRSATSTLLIPDSFWPSPVWAPRVGNLLSLACRTPGAAELTAAEIVDCLGRGLEGTIYLVVRDANGVRSLAGGEPPSGWPAALVDDALDVEACRRAGNWLATPLGLWEELPAALLVLAASEQRARQWHNDFSVVAQVVSEAADHARRVAAERRRLAMSSHLLELARRWAACRQLAPLLHDMAEAATRLLEADRATIFLWDRPHRLLIGRPALGVAGEELRLADDTGVVGRVIRSGRPERVDRGHAADQVDPDVDRQLGYHTRTLLCVPLLREDGQCLGAFQVLNKRGGNFDDGDESLLVELARHAAIALDNTREREQLIRNQAQWADQAASGVQLVGESPAIAALRSTVARVAQTELAVLVLGENGTGKEVVSRAIHYQSPRREQPLVAVNCAAISETLLESELFGHEQGAFTDAREARAGKFEAASGGTLLLDEIGEMSLAGQAKLLRVLEDKLVVRVGGTRELPVDVRVIAATNQPLAELVRQKRFRQDLYYRLSVVTLELPPLRHRTEDIVPLAEHFLDEFCRRAGRRALALSAAARRRLESHPWPGNVRELRNLIERLAYLLPGEEIEARDLVFLDAARQAELPAIDAALPLAEATDRFQIEHIRGAIRLAEGNVTAAAGRLGLHRSNLYRKMRQLGMPTDGSEAGFAGGSPA